LLDCGFQIFKRIIVSFNKRENLDGEIIGQKLKTQGARQKIPFQFLNTMPKLALNIQILAEGKAGGEENAQRTFST
jgi:hypothetical protein